MVGGGKIYQRNAYFLIVVIKLRILILKLNSNQCKPISINIKSSHPELDKIKIKIY